MDINSMSRELHRDVPETGKAIFTVDKIGLRIETIYLNQQMIEPWKRGNVITIIDIWGNLTGQRSCRV